MPKEIVLIISGLVTCLFALVLITLISNYAITENLDVVFYFLFMPIVILVIGFMIFRHGIMLKKKS